MSRTTTDRADEGINVPQANGQNEAYLVLSEEERAKGFVRPYRTTYKHVGRKPKHPLRDLTPDEQQRHSKFGYVAYEQYPESESPLAGRYWTQKDLESGCGTDTTMAPEIAETYSRDPKFYGSTFCVHCRTHRPVEEFEWLDGTVVGS